MELKILKPRIALNKAFLKVKPNRQEIETFKKNLIGIIDTIDEFESEEFHKNLVSDFLKNTYYAGNHFINTKGRNDLVIHNGATASSTVGVIIEAKQPAKKAEMLRPDNINVKAFQELVYYYLKERITNKNTEIKHLIATNIYEWYIFDGHLFEKLFAQNKPLVKKFIDFQEGRSGGNKTEFFYNEIAAPAIAALPHEITFTYFDIREYNKPLRNNDKKDDNVLIALYKLLSPEHLLKLPFANDSNSLDKVFYTELLHIIGLTETKEGGKKLIQRKEKGQRNAGSLLESAIVQLDNLDKIYHLEKPTQFGENNEERLFNVALELSITWINRILFLKLLEAQLIKYHKGDKTYAFLNTDKIKGFDDLNTLFFQVLARKTEERNEEVRHLFAHVPYLNSSLFEPTEIEHTCFPISQLKDGNLPVLSNSVIKDKTGKKRTGDLLAIEYIFEFLNAYDFSSEGSEEIQEDNKRLINASVLGLIFEKINGYKDGSFFTPGFITMYMCRETIRRAVLQKFNELKGWNCKTIDELYDKIEDRKEANSIINSLKLCDPAVGSGHFLVSALNEIIAIKSELRILSDREGKRLKEYSVVVENDELILTDEDGKLFEYNPTNKESQRVQETLFHEKQTIIENCLFGVDLNPNSVKICRLRLWIELLKNAYYKNSTELETLPNIDINIKCGNSLISRFALDSDLKQALISSKYSIVSYRSAVDLYRNAENKEQKREMEKLIATIKSDFKSNIDNPFKKTISTARAKVDNLASQINTKKQWGEKVDKKALAEFEKTVAKLKKLEDERDDIESNKIYENAFEWRFEFPEVLNDEGDFVGFDVVIGNPPYIVLSSFNDNEFKLLQEIYKTSYGRINTFALFTEFVGGILRTGSFCTLIIPDSLCNIDYYTNLRKYLLDRFKITEIIELGDGVFDEATVPAIIFSIEKTKQNLSNEIGIGERDDLFIKNLKYIPQNFYYSTPKNSFNLHVDDVFVKVQTTIREKMAKPLHEIATIKIGICTGNNNKFISNEPIFENSKKLLQGRDINKYSLKYNNLYVNYNKSELLRTRDESIFLKDEKLLMRQTSDSLIVTYDDSQYYTIDSLFIIYSNVVNLKYLLALMNSKLLNRQYQKINPEKGRVFAQVKIDYVNELPIIIDNKVEEKITTLVDVILSLKNQNQDTTSLESEIDQLVYQLYGLTEEEVKIVEGEK
ncbi:MAG TPA: TaqI-like C-terminal specificity domain-containing protein [Paludibacter sp.]